MELSAFALIHGIGPIDYSDPTWDYFGPVHHWYMNQILTVETFGEIHASGISEFMKRFYEKNKSSHVAAMEIGAQVDYEKYRDNEFFYICFYDRYNGEQARQSYVLYMDGETGTAIAMEPLNDSHPKAQPNALGIQNPLMYVDSGLFSDTDGLPKYTLIPLSDPSIADMFPKLKKEAMETPARKDCRNIHVISKPFIFKGVEGKLFFSYDPEDEKSVLKSPGDSINTIKDRLNSIGPFSLLDFEKQYCESIGDEYDDYIYRKNKTLTNLLKKEAGCYALFTNDVSITEPIALNLIDGVFIYSRMFFFTSAVENYEATDVKSLEELTGMTFVTFIGNLLRKRFVPIITPFIEKETDGLYKSVSSQLQKLYHFKVNVEKDHAELVKDKYEPERQSQDALAKAFDFTPTQLEEYTYRLWEIEGYFEEEEEEEEEDTYFY